MTTPGPYSADAPALPLSPADRALAAEALLHRANVLDDEANGCGDVDAATRRRKAAEARALASRLVVRP